MTDHDLSRQALLNNGSARTDPLTLDAGTDDVADGRVNVGLWSDASSNDVGTFSHDGTVHRVYDWDGPKKTVSGEFSADTIAALREHPDVRYVENDGTMQAIGQSTPWGIDRTDADLVRRRQGNTEPQDGGDIAILDTGIDSDHPDLAEQLGKGKAFTPCGKGANTCHQDWDDDNGHGTHCAGIVGAQDNTEGVVGVTTHATLHAVKVLTGRGGGYFSDIAAGIQWVADQGYDVASMSLGGPKSFLVEDAVEYAYANDVLLVAAAGNLGPCIDCVSFPAREPEVVSVGATTPDDSLATFSSTGPQVDILAPGQDIHSTYTDGGYETLNGTSMACPHVAAAGGMLMADGSSNSQARRTLEESAEPLDLAPEKQGHGLLDVKTALNYDTSGDNSTNGGNGNGR